MSDSTPSTFVKLNPEKLIELVEARPVLYNYNLKEYHNKILIDQMWNEVAEGMGGTVSECRNKWHSIRNAFARHLREERNPILTSSNGSKKKKWYLADMLSFLQNFVGHSYVGRKKILNISTDCSENSSQNSTELSSDYQLVQEIIITKEEKNTPNLDDKDNIEDEPLVSPESLPEQLRRIPEKKRKILSIPDSIEDIAQVVSEYLKEKNQTSEECESIHLNFFKSIIPDMVKLDGRRQRKFKEDVLSQLNHYLDEQENEFIVNPHLFRTLSPCSFSKSFPCSPSSKSLTVQAKSHPIWCVPVTSQHF